VLDITPLKILVILVVALVALGPERLPRLAHQAARAWGDLQRFRNHLGSEVRHTALGDSPMQPARSTASEPAPPPRDEEARSEMTASSSEEPERHDPGLN
jgi:Sec-independent protein translocase protein TatA